MFRLRLVLAALLCLNALDARAQEEVQAQLASLNEEMESTKAALSGLSDKMSAIRKDLALTQRVVADLKMQAEQGQREVASLVEQRTSLDREISNLDRNRELLATLMRKRVRLLYMRREEKPIQQILTVAGNADVAKALFYFSKIRAADQRALEEIKSGAERSANQRQRVVQLEAKQRAARARLEVKQGELKLKLAERQQLMESLKKEQVLQEDALLRLKAQSLRLESVLVSLMPGNRPLEVTSRKSAKMISAPSIEQFSGAGLRSLRGKLAQPIDGKLILGFGKRPKGAPDGEPALKGQLYAAQAYAVVHAVAPGRVVFVGQVPGVGQVAILDHGARTYSLYGRLSEVQVVPQQEVEGGTVLGKVGEPDESGAVFYLEFREAGQTINPATLFG